MMRADYLLGGVSSNFTTFVGHAGQDYGSSAFLHGTMELDVAITLNSNTVRNELLSRAHCGEFSGLHRIGMSGMG